MDLCKHQKDLVADCYACDLESRNRVRLLEQVAKAAREFSLKFGTNRHPVQDWYEDEFVALECALYELEENIVDEDHCFDGKGYEYDEKYSECSNCGW